MNEVLKQRMVGALILLALAVVFWPIVFVEPEEKPTTRQQSIPEPPAVSTSAIEAPDPAGLRTSSELAPYNDTQGAASAPVNATTDTTVDPDTETEPSASKAIAVGSEGVATAQGVPAEPTAAKPVPSQSSAAPVVRSEAPQRLEVDAQGVPVAWTLQVATVSSAEKAEALRRRLLDKHEKAYVTTVSSGGKQLYRVSVGPKFERRELERIQASVNAEFGVKTMLVRYYP